MNLIKTTYFKFILTITVIACGTLTYTIGHDNNFKILELNTNYNSLGLALRITTAVLGLFLISISFKDNPITRAKKTYTWGLLVGTIGLALEFALAALIIGVIIVVVLQAFS
jgi:uncharacterized membrane protein